MPRALVDLFAGLAAHVEPLVARAAYYEVGGGKGGSFDVGLCCGEAESKAWQPGRVVGGATSGHTAVSGRVQLPACLPEPLPSSSTSPPPPATPQVYNEQIYDLLDEAGVGPLGQRTALRLKEDALGRVFVAGLSEVRAGVAGHACFRAAPADPGLAGGRRRMASAVDAWTICC